MDLIDLRCHTFLLTQSLEAITGKEELQPLELEEE